MPDSHCVKTNDEQIETRFKRSNSYFPGRIVRGQTQSQYLNFGNSKEPGRAEAEATYGGSKAIVGKTLKKINAKVP